jgi:hypothetical protein
MWDVRGESQVYYYRHRRVGGRPRRVYVGTGAAAEEAAAEDARRKAERQADRTAAEADRRRYAAATEPLDGLAALVERLAKAALLGSGWKQHDRGEWRPWRAAAETDGNGSGAGR